MKPHSLRWAQSPFFPCTHASALCDLGEGKGGIPRHLCLFIFLSHSHLGFISGLDIEKEQDAASRPEYLSSLGCSGLAGRTGLG